MKPTRVQYQIAGRTQVQTRPLPPCGSEFLGLLTHRRVVVKHPQDGARLALVAKADASIGHGLRRFRRCGPHVESR